MFILHYSLYISITAKGYIPKYKESIWEAFGEDFYNTFLWI